MYYSSEKHDAPKASTHTAGQGAADGTEQPAVPSAAGEPVAPAAPSLPLGARMPRVYSNVERWLLLAALLMGGLFDWTVNIALAGGNRWLNWSAWPIFWLILLVFFVAFHWDKIKVNRIAWLVGGLCAALCLWFLRPAPWANSSYAGLTCLVIPLALMGFAQYVWGGFGHFDAAGLVLAWIAGFLIRPFSAIGRCFGAVGSLVGVGRKGRAVRVAAGCVLSAAVLMWLFSMMRRADLVFEYYVNQILGAMDFGTWVYHILFALVAGVLFYSFFWNTKWAAVPAVRMPEVRLDQTICAILLVSVLAAYALFSTVQFTFLFGRAGLPAGLTYSEYAVSGFWQVVGMAVFNLGLFGLMLRFGPEGRGVRFLNIGVLAATGIMLTSAAVRLGMYIGAYGMTWLRLLSAWFLIYLAAVLVLCAVRAFRRFPLVMVSAVLLLGWYVALGYWPLHLG